MPFRLWDRIRDWVILFGLLSTAVVLMLTLNMPLLRALRGGALEVTSAVESRFAWVGQYFRALEENSILRQENIELSSRLARSREARLENERLRSMLAFADSSEFPMVAAQIVSKDLFGSQNLLTLDVGRADSVDVDMAVVDERGIIGKVVFVSRNYSRVMPYLNTDFYVPAKVQPSQAAGIVRWPGVSYNRLQLEHVVKTEPVVAGQMVVTSGASGVFPEGYLIGRIDSVASKVARNALDIYLEPAAPLHSAEYAFVILQKPDPERTALEEKTVR